jgi:hypothetical protein
MYADDGLAVVGGAAGAALRLIAATIPDFGAG